MRTFDQPPDAPRRVRHVWVKLDLDGPRQPEPGLVLDWRRGQHGWEAWVVTVEEHSTGSGWGSTVRQAWRSVSFLRPATGEAPSREDWRG